MLPRAVGFVGVLLVERGGGEGCCLRGFGVVAVDGFGEGFFQAVAAARFYGEGVGPLAFYCVEYVFFFADGAEGCCEAVFLTRYPAFA